MSDYVLKTEMEDSYTTVYDHYLIHTIVSLVYRTSLTGLLKGIEFCEKYSHYVKDRSKIELDYANALRYV